MKIEDRINAIEADLQPTRDELKDILLDIRICLMAGQGPIPNEPGKGKLREELKSKRG